MHNFRSVHTGSKLHVKFQSWSTTIHVCSISWHLQVSAVRIQSGCAVPVDIPVGVFPSLQLADASKIHWWIIRFHQFWDTPIKHNKKHLKKNTSRALRFLPWISPRRDAQLGIGKVLTAFLVHMGSVPALSHVASKSGATGVRAPRRLDVGLICL